MLRQTMVENGVVRGMPAADPRITVFRGVPFAAPPVGERRWKAPQPADDWNGVLEAYTFAPASMQRVPGLNKSDIYTREFHVDPDIPMSEDCLYLNIWTPAKSEDEKLPVYVWFFGGALQVGYTSEMEFNGERLARRGVVVVTVNYRLNVFGFLAHPELTMESPEYPTNFGHLDQKFAVEWVKRNIAAFGGDPDNITIGGQSAGGASVLTQLTSPLTQGLFHKAIVQSAISLGAYEQRFGRYQTLEQAEKDGEDFFRYLGVSNLKEARALDAFYIRDKSLTYHKWHWGTVIDGHYVVDNPINLMLNNRRHMVPLLIGYTSSEFLSSPKVSSFEELEKIAAEKFGDRDGEFLDICKSPDLNETIKRATFNSSEVAVRTVFKRSLQADAPDNYFYMFDAFIPGEDTPGTFHSVDLWFFFETLALCWRPFTGVHYDLARMMCNYWANFIKNGNPNGPDADGTPMPEWKPFSEGEYPMVFTDRPKMANEAPDRLMSFLVDFYLR